jgi:MoaA/NifB/PqqE/SkfB family radical SAM enzyme
MLYTEMNLYEWDLTMKLTGLHLLLTYQCTFECDHCFVWGSPWQSGVMNLQQIHEVLRQARENEEMEWIYFEGGEPFLYYPILLRGAQMATAMGFRVGIVSNAYWATSLLDAKAWLKPLADLIEDLTLSSDLYHYSEPNSIHIQNAKAAAEELNIPLGSISVAQPEQTNAFNVVGQIAAGESAVMYRGRAADRLISRAVYKPWQTFTTCPHEDLRNPGRAHLDPFGNLHICQGITIGNVFNHPLKEICESYYAEAHPICGPLLRGGPAELVNEYKLVHGKNYADACHLCYESRVALRKRFPDVLMPDQMYGG